MARRRHRNLRWARARIGTLLAVGIALVGLSLLACTTAAPSGGGSGELQNGGSNATTGMKTDAFQAEKCEVLTQFRTQQRRWEKTDLTWGIAVPPEVSAMTLADVEFAMEIATGLWDDASALSITRATNPDNADIRISFFVGEHDDGEENAFDGPNGVLAHAFFPQSQLNGVPMDGKLDVCDEENFTVDITQSANLIDLTFVLTHELGHSLGLAHSSNPLAVMAPTYQSWTAHALHDDDIQSIQELYGDENGNFPPSRLTAPQLFNPEAALPARPTLSEGGRDPDGDGLDSAFETFYLSTDPSNIDTDDDGLEDGIEAVYGTDPIRPDSDGDGLTDGEELLDASRRTNPLNPCDPSCESGDSDGDGLSDDDERILRTNPNDPDTDRDFLNDFDEIHTYGTSPRSPDTDGDGCPDGEDPAPKKSRFGCEPVDAEFDTDGDRIPDDIEMEVFGTDPNNPDSDGDNLTDDFEVYVLQSNPNDCTSPLSDGCDTDPFAGSGADADEDGITDAQEVFFFRSNPNDCGDPFPDGCVGTAFVDSDLDGISDSDEMDFFRSDPADPCSPHCFSHACQEGCQNRPPPSDDEDFCDRLGFYGDDVCDPDCPRPDPDCEGIDWCEELGWYDDEICDVDCPMPDPDCAFLDNFNAGDNGRPNRPGGAMGDS